jgi:hypothetical protein
MRHTPTLAVATIISLTFGIAGPTCHAVAQETLHVSFKVPAENSKYTQQVNLNVTGSPNHIMRAYELHRTYPGNPPVIGGLKLVESWEQGIGDRFDGNGDGTSYTAFVLENGDKFTFGIPSSFRTCRGRLSLQQLDASLVELESLLAYRASFEA